MDANFQALTEATAGAVGGLLSTTILYPLDTCKTKFQADAQQGGLQRYRSVHVRLYQQIRGMDTTFSAVSFEVLTPIITLQMQEPPGRSAGSCFFWQRRQPLPGAGHKERAVCDVWLRLLLQLQLHQDEVSPVQQEKNTNIRIEHCCSSCGRRVHSCGHSGTHFGLSKLVKPSV